jgi:hypothetical protein
MVVVMWLKPWRCPTPLRTSFPNSVCVQPSHSTTYISYIYNFCSHESCLDSGEGISAVVEATPRLDAMVCGITCGVKVSTEVGADSGNWSPHTTTWLVLKLDCLFRAVQSQD